MGKIQVKRGLETNLPTLATGEFGFCTDTENLYIGGNNGNVCLTEGGGAGKFEYEATLTTDWVGDSAPYTQTVVIEGILADDEPHIAPIYSSDTETALLERDAWNMVSKAESVGSGITFTCFEDVPEQPLTLKIEVVRNDIEGDPTQITCENLGAATIHHTHSEYAPIYTYGTEDLTAGESKLATGVLYFVYE